MSAVYAELQWCFQLCCNIALVLYWKQPCDSFLSVSSGVPCRLWGLSLMKFRIWWGSFFSLFFKFSVYYYFIFNPPTTEGKKADQAPLFHLKQNYKELDSPEFQTLRLASGKQKTFSTIYFKWWWWQLLLLLLLL